MPGHSADFRRYIAEEVIPLVEARYRTDGTREVIKESLAGLFIVESALTEAELFQHHAAISPSLWWDGERLSRQAARSLARQGKAAKLYLRAQDRGGGNAIRLQPAAGSGARRLRPSVNSGWCAVLARPRFAALDDLSHAQPGSAAVPVSGGE